MLDYFLFDQWVFAFILNFILVLLFHRLPLLTNRGWIHAGALGTILFGTLGWRGWIAVVIYLCLGSAVTRLGYKKKKKEGLAEAREGRRGPENVWGSSATGAIIAILSTTSFISYDILLLAFSASFAAKLADTFGSEIGKRWGRTTYLIISFEKVAPGTEGAISLEGTIASLFGSSLMIYFMSLLGFVPFNYIALLLTIVGFVSTLIESILGALVQNKYRFLTNELINFIQTTISAVLAFLLSIYIL